MSPVHLTVALVLAAIPASAVQLTRVLMLRIALQGSKPSERAAILRSLATIQPFNRPIAAVDSARRVRAKVGDRLPASQREADAAD